MPAAAAGTTGAAVHPDTCTCNHVQQDPRSSCLLPALLRTLPALSHPPAACTPTGGCAVNTLSCLFSLSLREERVAVVTTLLWMAFVTNKIQGDTSLSPCLFSIYRKGICPVTQDAGGNNFVSRVLFAYIEQNETEKF